MVTPGVAILSGATTEHEAGLTVNRGPTTFVISVSFNEIRDTTWGTEYLQQLGMCGHDANDLIINLCMSTIRNLAPVSSIQGLPIEALCRARSYRIKITSGGSKENEGVCVILDGDAVYERSHGLLPISVPELPRSCTGINRIAATDVSLSTAGNQLDNHNADFPHGRVVLTDGTAAYFKPSLGHGAQFERELGILGRIEHLRLRKELNRFTHLIGIVTTGQQGVNIVGMLLELIPTLPQGGDLLHETMRARTDMHQKWKTQVVQMVEELHAHDIVWGDVNAGNVVIDNDLNAHLIDFGGMNNAEFVDDELAETVEGDWQGVHRLFDGWLPSRRPDS